MAKLEPLKLEMDVVPLLAAVALPGDTVLVGFDRSLSDEELEDLREGFQGFTEATGVHFAFVEHATSMVVMRPDVEVERTEAEVFDGEV